MNAGAPPESQKSRRVEIRERVGSGGIACAIGGGEIGVRSGRTAKSISKSTSAGLPDIRRRDAKIAEARRYKGLAEAKSAFDRRGLLSQFLSQPLPVFPT
jgi:hypothetical protein